MSRDEKLHSNATTSSSKLTSKPFSKISQKFRSAGQPAGPTSRMLGNRYSPNPQDTTTDPFVPAPRFPEKRKLDENDRSSVSDNDDSVHSNDEKLKPAPGKKTRGRVKIQMEYIQNKLRRYTTFSKRKSGIMKKVRWLSCCEGTCHVYSRLFVTAGLRTEHPHGDAGDAAGGLRDGTRLHVCYSKASADDNVGGWQGADPDLPAQPRARARHLQRRRLRHADERLGIRRDGTGIQHV